MTGFGHKTAWLAVRVDDPEAVITGLGLLDLGEVDWRAGLDAAYLTDDRVALTPALPGARDARWVLAVGRRLARIEVAEVVALSVALATEVQLFDTHRVVEAHRWARAVDGVLVREFGYVGETGAVTGWRGDPDETERAIGLPLQGPGGDEVDILVGEGDVLRVARAWSVDPTTLDGRPAPGPLRVAAADAP
jgi:hypothetical protein